MNPRAIRVLVILTAFAAGLVFVLGVILLVVGSNPVRIAAPAAIGGPFQLVGHDERSLSDADLKGKPFLVFFGFTHCPDVCPTTLFEVSEVLRALGPEADRTRALFVTVDPERDTPAKLKDYLPLRGPAPAARGNARRPRGRAPSDRAAPAEGSLPGHRGGP